MDFIKLWAVVIFFVQELFIYQFNMNKKILWSVWCGLFLVIVLLYTVLKGFFSCKISQSYVLYDDQESKFECD